MKRVALAMALLVLPGCLVVSTKGPNRSTGTPKNVVDAVVQANGVKMTVNSADPNDASHFMCTGTEPNPGSVTFTGTSFCYKSVSSVQNLTYGALLCPGPACSLGTCPADTRDAYVILSFTTLRDEFASNAAAQFGTVSAPTNVGGAALAESGAVITATNAAWELQTASYAADGSSCVGADLAYVPNAGASPSYLMTESATPNALLLGFDYARMGGAHPCGADPASYRTVMQMRPRPRARPVVTASAPFSPKDESAFNPSLRAPSYDDGVATLSASSVKGQPFVQIESRYLGYDPMQVRVLVADTGIGIERAARENGAAVVYLRGGDIVTKVTADDSSVVQYSVPYRNVHRAIRRAIDRGELTDAAWAAFPPTPTRGAPYASSFGVIGGATGELEVREWSVSRSLS